jgi:O-methyltransferase
MIDGNLGRTFKTFVRTVLPKKIVTKIDEIRNPPLFTYEQDGLKTKHNADFMNDPNFKKAYEAGAATGSWNGVSIHWRAFVACWAASIGSRLEGDFVECGVNKGGLARTAIEYVDFRNLKKRFFLLDTYEGLSGKYLTDAERRGGTKEGGYEPCYDAVVRTFSSYGSQAVIIKGPVPETLPQVTAAKIAYLSIDMNCVLPEIAAAETFWPRLSTGAVIVLDDYGWSPHYEQKKAFDIFAKERGVMVLALPTGQGIIVKS